MEPADFIETFDHIVDDVAAIIHNQQRLADIHEQLDRNLLNPFEQDFIYQDHFGEKPSEPRHFVHNGVRITTRVLHQTGIRLEDIQGADLLYEIEQQSFVLIQYKRSAGTSIRNDVHQLDMLIKSCPDVCSNKRKRLIPFNWIPLRLNSFCGCWYCVFNGPERRYVHACEAEAIFGGQKSSQIRHFSSGLTKESFLELFASRRIGGFFRAYPGMMGPVLHPNNYVQQLMDSSHIIYNVNQESNW